MSTESQIGLGDGVEVEVGDHVDEVEVYEVVDLELDLEEGELDLACLLSIVLRKTGRESMNRTAMAQRCLTAVVRS